MTLHDQARWCSERFVRVYQSRRNTCKGSFSKMSSHKIQNLIHLCLVFVVYFNKYAESQLPALSVCTPLFGSTKKCACTYTDGATTRHIDFTPLGKTDGTAAFAYKISGDYKYAYNPCFPFTDNFCTTNTAACQVSNDEQYKYPIGKPDDVSYTVDNSDIVITYAALETRSAVVNFHCDEKALTKATYQPFGDVAGGPYKFTIGTCLACLKDVPNCHGTPSGGGNSGLTVGGVFCIIFTVLVVVYIVGGILFQKFGRGATGKELVPNYGFWSDFPILVKDGFMFLIGLCRGESSGSGYESIK